jgi:hypothetical protein
MPQGNKRSSEKSSVVNEIRVPVPETKPTLEHAFTYLKRKSQKFYSIKLGLSITDPYNSKDPGWVYIVSGRDANEAAGLLKEWDGQ